MTKLGHLTRVPARCAAQHLQHLVQLAARAASSERRRPAKRTGCSVDLHAARSGAQMVSKERVPGDAGKALLNDRGVKTVRAHER